MTAAADLTHAAGRIPDGQGHSAEGERRHHVDVAEQRVQLAARVLLDALASDDLGARRHCMRLSTARTRAWTRGGWPRPRRPGCCG